MGLKQTVTAAIVHILQFYLGRAVVEPVGLLIVDFEMIALGKAAVAHVGFGDQSSERPTACTFPEALAIGMGCKN